MQIWKALVHNTPKTGSSIDRSLVTLIDPFPLVVREILPELMNQIIILISASEFEQQEVHSVLINLPSKWLTKFRRLLAQLQNYVANMVRRLWAN